MAGFALDVVRRDSIKVNSLGMTTCVVTSMEVNEFKLSGVRRILDYPSIFAAFYLFLALGIVSFPWVKTVQAETLSSRNEFLESKELATPGQKSLKIPISLGDNEAVIFGSDKILFRHNASHLMIPASLMKLVTTLVAIREGLEFKTQIEYRPVERTKGELHFTQFDPFIRDEDLEVIIPLLKERFPRIRGLTKLVIRGFKGPLTENYPNLDSLRPYNARPSVVSLNFNNVGIDFCGTPKLKSPFAHFAIKRLNKKSPGIFGVGKDLVTVGFNKRRRACFTDWAAVNYPIEHFVRAFAGGLGLSSRDLEVVHEEVREYNDLFEECKSCIVHKRKGVTEVLQAMNQFSNNFIADSIINMVSFKTNQSDVTALIGEILGKNYLQGSFNDGSGLSSENRITAESLYRILNEFDTEALRILLAESGVSGTLKRTNFGSLKVFAKTGTLTNVRNLAGIVSSKGKDFRFVIMQNGKSRNAALKREKQILEALTTSMQ